MSDVREEPVDPIAGKSETVQTFSTKVTGRPEDFIHVATSAEEMTR